MAYCEPTDVYLFGVPRGSLPNDGRLVHSVDTSADTLALDMHGFAEGTELLFRAEAGGSLPSPLTANTTYYASPVNQVAFQVSATDGGTAIDLTTEGENVVVIGPSEADNACEWASRIIDDMLPAHTVPIEGTPPEIIRTTAAELAAGKLMTMRGVMTESLASVIEGAQKRLDRWSSKGAPIRGTNAPQSANLSARATAVPSTDTRGWRRYGGL